LFEKIAPGIRSYTLCDWEDLGLEGHEIHASSMDIMGGFENQTIYTPGIVPILPELYVAIKDFNPDDRERSLDEKKGGVRILAYRAGELILMTLT
jgi:hypothetical protein